MQQGYFATAWADLKGTKNWFGKVCLLALLMFIPIFGPIVLYGYAYGWARDIAWGVNTPAPSRIFENADGKLFTRGFFILVLGFVLSLIPSILSGMNTFEDINRSIMLMNDMYSSYSQSMASGAYMGGSLASSLITLVVLVLSVAVTFFMWVGSMRIAIYDNLSSGFQLGRIWKMMKYDPKGLLRIFGFTLIYGLITGLILGILLLIIGIPIIAMIVGAAIPAQDVMMYGDEYQAISYIFSAVGSYIGLILVAALIIGFVISALSVFGELITARMLGYWTRQFNVAQWGPQDAPMPFEVAQANQPQAYTQQAQSTYQPSGQAPSGYQQVVADQGSQPKDAQSPSQAPAQVQQPPAPTGAPVVMAAPEVQSTPTNASQSESSCTQTSASVTEAAPDPSPSTHSEESASSAEASSSTKLTSDGASKEKGSEGSVKPE